MLLASAPHGLLNVFHAADLVSLLPPQSATLWFLTPAQSLASRTAAACSRLLSNEPSVVRAGGLLLAVGHLLLADWCGHGLSATLRLVLGSSFGNSYMLRVLSHCT